LRRRALTASDQLVYFDASAVIEVLLGQPRAAEAGRVWDEAGARVSSTLFEAECRTVVRRALAARTRTPRVVGPLEATRQLADRLDGITLQSVDRSVLDTLAAEPRLGACRTLDAVHLATALELRASLGRVVTVCTLDADMAAAARGLGFAVVP
jgi:predicted nucleic acid-binding protein